MHSFQMPTSYVERTIARQGRPHVLEHCRAQSTALLVVDMQNYFLFPPYPAACPVAQTIVPNINRLAKVLRDAGGSVVWIQNHAPYSQKDWPTQRARFTDAEARLRWDALQIDAHGFQLCSDLEVLAEDLRVVKTRYSPFAKGSSNLEDVLRSNEIDTVIVTGVATNACCDSTARDAMMLNFRSLMVSDACAAKSDAEHEAALSHFYLYFGDVQSTAQIVNRID